ncbi:hypothetical protein A3K73_01115 [Candidatus Pacearchaeota archaeon RBG_13_36_9]|nr:MAG: hypothetical protein A3K73_01115 [Candidatus Pacearchaeota archaeon RBG_13_36_9]
MWYTPWAFQRYETQEVERKDSTRSEARRGGEGLVRQTKLLLHQVSIIKCLRIETFNNGLLRTELAYQRLTKYRLF